MLDGWWGLGGPGRWELVGVTEWVSLRPGARHLTRLGVSIFLGPLSTAPYRSQQNKDSEYQGRCGVGSCCSWSARRRSYKRDRRQIVQASQGCPVDCCDPRQAVSSPHVCLPLCEAVTWRWLCPGCQWLPHEGTHNLQEEALMGFKW